MPPAARLMDMHTCPMVTVLVPHVGGPVSGPCAPTVLIGGMPAARATDMCVCVGPPDVIIKGSAGVFIVGLPAARIGDPTAHGGVIVSGFPSVLIGETGGGGAGFGGGTATAGQGDVASLLSSAPGTPMQSKQAEALTKAASDGTPFVERCA